MLFRVVARSLPVRQLVWCPFHSANFLHRQLAGMRQTSYWHGTCGRRHQSLAVSISFPVYYSPHATSACTPSFRRMPSLIMVRIIREVFHLFAAFFMAASAFLKVSTLFRKVKTFMFLLIVSRVSWDCQSFSVPSTKKLVEKRCEALRQAKQRSPLRFSSFFQARSVIAGERRRESSFKIWNCHGVCVCLFRVDGFAFSSVVLIV